MFPVDTAAAAAAPPEEMDPLIHDTLLFDTDARRFVLEDGSPGRRRGERAVRQWLVLMLRTYRGRFPVYAGTQLGHSGEDLLGMRQVPIGFIHAELAREIREACLLCPAIARADRFSFHYEKRALWVQFSVWLKDGAVLEVDELVG